MALLDLVARVAEANDGVVQDRDGNRLRIKVRPTLDSGAAPYAYGIEVSVFGGALLAREHGSGSCRPIAPSGTSTRMDPSACTGPRRSCSSS